MIVRLHAGEKDEEETALTWLRWEAPRHMLVGRQFVFRSGGDNNHKLECGLKSAGYPYVSYSSIQRCITICSTVYCQVLKILFEQ